MVEPRLFLDTNILLRYLTNDIPEQAQKVETWLRKAGTGECVLVTHHLVLAELAWTLLSYYQRPVPEVQSTMLAILNTPGLEVEDEQILIQATHWFGEKNIDFIHAYTACLDAIQQPHRYPHPGPQAFPALRGIEYPIPVEQAVSLFRAN